jgi:hypothetical protein
MYESKMKFTESRAHEIAKIMNLVTNTVLRYTETMLQVKILSITIDYVIDKRSQIWMLWAPEAKFVRATSLENVELPNIVDVRGRAAWMGDKYFEDVKDRELYDKEVAQQPRRYDTSSEAPRSYSPNSRATGPMSGKTGGGGGFSPARSRGVLSTTAAGTEGSPTSHGVGSVYQPYPAEEDRSVTLHATIVQVNEAVNANVHSSKTQRKRVNDNESTTFSVMQNSTGGADVTGQFPHPFKCKGDYCSFNITPAGNLAPNAEQAAVHITQKLFTAKELEQLRKDKNFNRMMEFESSGPALAVLTMRSILLARQERRGLDSVNTSQPWTQYPESPRSKIKFRPDSVALESGDMRSKEQMVSLLGVMFGC